MRLASGFGGRLRYLFLAAAAAAAAAAFTAAASAASILVSTAACLIVLGHLHVLLEKALLLHGLLVVGDDLRDLGLLGLDVLRQLFNLALEPLRFLVGLLLDQLGVLLVVPLLELLRLAILPLLLAHLLRLERVVDRGLALDGLLLELLELHLFLVRDDGGLLGVVVGLEVPVVGAERDQDYKGGEKVDFRFLHVDGGTAGVFSAAFFASFSFSSLMASSMAFFRTLIWWSGLPCFRSIALSIATFASSNLWSSYAR